MSDKDETCTIRIAAEAAAGWVQTSTHDLLPDEMDASESPDDSEKLKLELDILASELGTEEDAPPSEEEEEDAAAAAASPRAGEDGASGDAARPAG